MRWGILSAAAWLALGHPGSAETIAREAERGLAAWRCAALAQFGGYEKRHDELFEVGRAALISALGRLDGAADPFQDAEAPADVDLALLVPMLIDVPDGASRHEVLQLIWDRVATEAPTARQGEAAMMFRENGCGGIR